MRKESLSSANGNGEINVLNAIDLDVEELEQRLEMALSLPDLAAWCAADCSSNCSAVCQSNCSAVCQSNCSAVCQSNCSTVCGVNLGSVA